VTQNSINDAPDVVELTSKMSQSSSSTSLGTAHDVTPLEGVKGEGTPRTRLERERLARSYDAWGRPEQAARYRN